VRAAERRASCQAVTKDRMRSANRVRGRVQAYSWPVKLRGDLWLVAFHVMATEGKVHVGQGSRVAHGDTGGRVRVRRRRRAVRDVHIR